MRETAESFGIAKPVSFNPGIPGFVKASRHRSGPCLVMTTWDEGDEDWISIFWVKRLIHNAWRFSPQEFRLMSERTITAAERTFEYSLLNGPPPMAIRDAQKQRVYDWEDDVIKPGNDKPMPWSGCLLFARYVWERVGAGRPLALTYEGRALTACSLGGEIYIPELDQRYHTKHVILHEIAHELTEFDGHGPGFVSAYMDLSVRFLGMNRRELEETALDYGVNFLG